MIDLRIISTNLFKNQLCPSIRLSRLRALGCVRRRDKVSIVPDPHDYGAHGKCLREAVMSLGMTGIPVYNVNNNCATGSSALFLAHQLISGNCNTLPPPPPPLIGTNGKVS
jgi:hypothetical protein